MCFCQYLLAPSCHGVWLPEIDRSRICNSVPEAGEFYPNKVFAPCRSGCQLPIYRRGCAALFVVTKPFKKVKTVQNDGWNQQILYKMTAWKSIVHQNLFKKSLHNDPNNGFRIFLTKGTPVIMWGSGNCTQGCPTSCYVFNLLNSGREVSSCKSHFLQVSWFDRRAISRPESEAPTRRVDTSDKLRRSYRRQAELATKSKWQSWREHLRWPLRFGPNSNSGRAGHEFFEIGRFEVFSTKNHNLGRPEAPRGDFDQIQWTLVHLLARLQGVAHGTGLYRVQPEHG